MEYPMIESSQLNWQMVGNSNLKYGYAMAICEISVVTHHLSCSKKSASLEKKHRSWKSSNTVYLYTPWN